MNTPATSKGTNPLILTLRPDTVSQDYFNRLRKQYFPPAINYLQAHITLFHHLPPDEPLIYQTLEEVSRMNCFDVVAESVYHTGFGVAFKLVSPELQLIHHRLQTAFGEWLKPQDLQKFRPHITIQNKVSADESKLLTSTLQKEFIPLTLQAEGFDLWIYESGPWKHFRSFNLAQ